MNASHMRHDVYLNILTFCFCSNSKRDTFKNQKLFGWTNWRLHFSHSIRKIYSHLFAFDPPSLLVDTCHSFCYFHNCACKCSAGTSGPTSYCIVINIISFAILACLRCFNSFRYIYIYFFRGIIIFISWFNYNIYCNKRKKFQNIQFTHAHSDTNTNINNIRSIKHIKINWQ